ncbi:MAG TPA: V-type ATP synthase subunit D [Thermoprotei archaeon]|nr:V-type ATP synthase subunit D [Thermoprotei archaeon]
MSLTSTRFLPISRGTLIYLKNMLNTIERGKNILEMRREQLIKEIFLLSSKLKERASIEHEYIRALEKVARLRLLRGEVEFESMLSLVKPPQIEILPTSIQGVMVPQARIFEEPDLSQLQDPEFLNAFKDLWKIIRILLELSNIEIAIEKLSEQLAYINRVVNSLDKSVIPKYKELIRYIEERIEEQSIDEFIKLKNIHERISV